MVGKVNLGMNIEAARRQVLLSQRELAKEIGVSQVTLCQYEKGRMTPPLDRLEQIAQSCRTTVQKLTDYRWEQNRREWVQVPARIEGGRTVNRFSRGHKSGTVLLLNGSRRLT